MSDPREFYSSGSYSTDIIRKTIFQRELHEINKRIETMTYAPDLDLNDYLRAREYIEMNLRWLNANCK